MAYSQAQNKATQKYQSENLEQLSIRVAIGCKAELKAERKKTVKVLLNISYRLLMIAQERRFSQHRPGSASLMTRNDALCRCKPFSCAE